MGLIFFDLDGTLVDPCRAMEHCLELTLSELGLEPPARGTVAATVGLGAAELFAGRPELQDPARLRAALDSYWRHFAEQGIAKHRIYEGVNLLLARLKRQGHRLYAVTVLPTRYARQVLHQFDLLLAFDEVFGSPLGGAGLNKGEVLAQVQQQGVLVSAGHLVGDRAVDVRAALTYGLTPVGVTYGFAEAGELQAAGAELLFSNLPLLDAWFETQYPEPETHDAFTRSE